VVNDDEIDEKINAKRGNKFDKHEKIVKK